MVDSNVTQKLQDIANLSRIQVIEITEAAGSGHPTTCSSAADILSVLFFHESGMHYLPNDPMNFASDRLVLSKGHAAPILYSMWCLNGHLTKEQIMTLRRIDSDIEGHPTPRLDFVDVATGSLGQGLGVGVGMSYASKYIDKIDNRYFVLLGDGETAEGSVWEALNLASHYKLDNLCAIIDVNGLGQASATLLQHNVKVYEERVKAFGWEVVVIDGHNVSEVIGAFQAFRKNTGKPFAIIAKTEKGKHFTDSIEGKLNWHGKALGKDMAAKAIEYIRTLIKDPNASMTPTKPTFECKTPEFQPMKLPDVLDYDPKKEYATRNAFGSGLKRLGAEDKTNQLVSLDGDTKNSTFSCTLEQTFPNKFVEGFIAEQNLASVAQGLSCRRKVPFMSAFAAFLSRAFDQVRMGSISMTNTKYVGTHAGISIGDDGGSQMGLEDIAMFRALGDSVVLYPSDAIAAERAIELTANHKGTVYVRCGRPAHELIYPNDEKFEIGKAKVLIRSDSDKITIASSGVTLIEAKKAAQILKDEGINVRVVDLFSIKPVDSKTLLHCAHETHNRILVVEDHYASGGLFDAVAGGVAEHGVKLYHSCVEKLPRSGKPAELYEMFGLSAKKIAERVKKIVH